MNKITLTACKEGPGYRRRQYWHVGFGRVSVTVESETPNVLRLRHDDLVEQRLCVATLPTNGRHTKRRRKRAAAEPAKRKQA